MWNLGNRFLSMEAGIVQDISACLAELRWCDPVESRIGIVTCNSSDRSNAIARWLKLPQCTFKETLFLPSLTMFKQRPPMRSWETAVWDNNEPGPARSAGTLALDKFEWLRDGGEVNNEGRLATSSSCEYKPT
eukprot:TRINITY_DN416_c1_g1_i2.p2 TRINITY_DN416_c1_g1~~TRINITY_DN416_c1_g1_i2.p2  ORF type:complete len:133 (-),score=8.75 TRINITY_DN416_c1_g1_i2:74-472(-)